MRVFDDARFRSFHGAIVSVALLGVNSTTITMVRRPFAMHVRDATRRTTVARGAAG
jgi:hypothetical protein